jgi:hypothetical protein
MTMMLSYCLRNDDRQKIDKDKMKERVEVQEIEWDLSDKGIKAE